ncbi:MAG TPA: FtsX-like permease family protein [Bacteroidales bacterium]|nr:FtsX-like permease family protein [Bacteroidales bacterium]
MNTELYIARRLYSESSDEKKISRPIISIAIVGIALGLAVMIVSVAIVTGFKSEIRNKIIGFGSHIQIINYDANISFETQPISQKQDFYPALDSIEGIQHIQAFAIKAGILKTRDNIQGAVLKGVGPDFDWSFFRENITRGSAFQVSDTATTDQIVLSQYIANLLELDTADYVGMYFVEDPPRMRRFQVAGIYNTGLQELDKQFIIGDIKHVQRLNNWDSHQISGFEVLVEEFEKIPAMASMIRNNYTYKVLPDGSKLKVISITDKYPQIFDWLEVTDINVWVILILMIAVAGFNMISGLLILILERTNMIGLFKAMGSKNWNIRKIFLYLSSFLIGKGMLWGNIIGIALCLIQMQFGLINLDPTNYMLTDVPINLKILHIILLNAGSLIVTILMLVVPSYVVAKISPIKTIRFN